MFQKFDCVRLVCGISLGACEGHWAVALEILLWPMPRVCTSFCADAISRSSLAVCRHALPQRRRTAAVVCKNPVQPWHHSYAESCVGRGLLVMMLLVTAHVLRFTRQQCIFYSPRKLVGRGTWLLHKLQTAAIAIGQRSGLDSCLHVDV